MSDGVNLIRESERGLKARQLMDNPIYKEAVGVVRQAIFDKWAESPVADRDGQHELRLMLKALDMIVTHIKDVAETGKLADTQIEQEKSRAARLKDKVVNFWKK